MLFARFGSVRRRQERTIIVQERLGLMVVLLGFVHLFNEGLDVVLDVVDVSLHLALACDELCLVVNDALVFSREGKGVHRSI